MSAPHTPGPWKLGASGLFVFPTNGSITPIAVICVTGNWGPSYDLEIAGNAALIAAAPEMLAALREIVAPHMGCADSDEEVREILSIAKRFIAKAEGGAQ